MTPAATDPNGSWSEAPCHPGWGSCGGLFAQRPGIKRRQRAGLSTQQTFVADSELLGHYSSAYAFLAFHSKRSFYSRVSLHENADIPGCRKAWVGESARRARSAIMTLDGRFDSRMATNGQALQYPSVDGHHVAGFREMHGLLSPAQDTESWADGPFATRAGCEASHSSMPSRYVIKVQTGL